MSLFQSRRHLVNTVRNGVILLVGARCCDDTAITMAGVAKHWAPSHITVCDRSILMKTLYSKCKLTRTLHRRMDDEQQGLNECTAILHIEFLKCDYMNRRLRGNVHVILFKRLPKSVIRMVCVCDLHCRNVPLFIISFTQPSNLYYETQYPIIRHLTPISH